VIYVIENNGAYKITEGLWKKYGDKRLVDTPISEAGFIGMGIGAAMLGLRPVIEIMFWSFAYVAYDQIINNAGCVRYMSGGLVNVPIVIRGPANGGTNVGAQIAATLQEKIFDELDAPVGRVTSLDAPAIYSPPLEKRQLPGAARVIAKVLEIC
jgi:pyruvate/2-oxoglutarate/acetoin dehydrogenase E1 component